MGFSGEAEQRAVEHPPLPPQWGGRGAQQQKLTNIWSAGARRTHNRRVEPQRELGANTAQLPSGASHRKFINSLISTNRRHIEAHQYRFLLTLTSLTGTIPEQRHQLPQ
jgi:hypothetical protein